MSTYQISVLIDIGVRGAGGGGGGSGEGKNEIEKKCPKTVSQSFNVK